MLKRFAPLAMLFGMLTALLLGSTAVAQATTPLTTFTQCTNEVKVIGIVNVPVVTCIGTVTVDDVVTCIGTVTVDDVVKNVKVEILNEVLSDNDLVTLKNNLNNANIPIYINILNVITNVGDVTTNVVNVYNNQINPDITVGNVILNVLCPC